MHVSTNENLSMADVTNEQLATLTQLADDHMPSYVAKTTVKPFVQTAEDGSMQTIYVKDETQQPGRSFKDRGAAFAVGQYAAQGAEAVVTASAGNHGMGLARAAQYYGTKATVVLPITAEAVKKQAVADLGAELVEVDGDFSDAEAFARNLAKQRHTQFVHPFADPYVAAGQGTVALELTEQLPGVTAVYVPVGGGGLLAGMGSFLQQIPSPVRVASAQVAEANTFTQSARADRPVEVETLDARFGGLAVRRLDTHTLRLARRVTNTCAQVDALAVFKTVYDYRRATGVLLEPAGAVGLAVARAQVARSRPDVVATVLTGANAASDLGAHIDQMADELGW